MLGYHKGVGAESSSTRTYARQPMVEPLRQLGKVFAAIADGSFDPVTGRKDEAAALPVRADDVVESSTSDDSSSTGLSDPSVHGSASQASDYEAEEAAISLSMISGGLEEFGDERYYKNVGSGKIHHGRPGSDSYTLCGEPLDKFQQVSSFDEKTQGGKASAWCLTCQKIK